MKEKKPVNYVDNEKFYKAIVDYRQQLKEAREQGKEPPRIPDYIGECFLKIGNHLARLPKFANYSFKDEMIADGVENCIRYFEVFDPSVGINPFAYFTTTFFRAFIRRINSEEKARYGLYSNFIETVTVGDMHLMTDEAGNGLLTHQMYDNISAFMERFEKKEQDKKEKRKLVPVGLQKFYEED